MLQEAIRKAFGIHKTHRGGSTIWRISTEFKNDCTISIGMTDTVGDSYLQYCLSLIYVNIISNNRLSRYTMILPSIVYQYPTISQYGGFQLVMGVPERRWMVFARGSGWVCVTELAAVAPSHLGQRRNHVPVLQCGAPQIAKPLYKPHVTIIGCYRYHKPELFDMCVYIYWIWLEFLQPIEL